MSEPENRDSAAQRDASGRFAPGNSANPGGRSKVQREIQDALDQGAGEAAKVIMRLLVSKDEKVQLAAARDVLDRVVGKAPQAPEDRDAAGAALIDLLSRLRAGAE